MWEKIRDSILDAGIWLLFLIARIFIFITELFETKNGIYLVSLILAIILAYIIIV